MKILFLVPYPKSEAPSQRFRFEQYITLLQKENYQIKFESFFNYPLWIKIYNPKSNALDKFLGVIYGFLKRVKVLFICSPFKFIFIHREVTPFGPPIFEWILSRIFSKKIIYDIDDAIWLKDNKSESLLFTLLKNRSKIKHILKFSYKVSCGNNFLKSYCQQYNSNIILNPTTIDTNYHIPKKKQASMSNKIVIGWTGTHTTLKYLDLVVPILQELELEFEFEFMVIANQCPKLNLSNYIFIPWNKSTEIADLQKIDIGLMPLYDNEWEHGKCGFKALQFMALEIPVLVSPVGVNNIIVDHGINGFHCASDSDWKKFLLELISSLEKRIKMGENGRKYIVKNYSVDSNADNFLSLFK